MINGKPKKIMHDNGKQFTSKIFKRFLEYNNIKDKPIPNFYPQLQGKIEAYNKIVKQERIHFSRAHIKHRRGEDKIRYVCQGIQRQKGRWGDKWLHHLKCFYKHSIDPIPEIIPSRKVSPMCVIESVTYVCNPCEPF